MPEKSSPRPPDQPMITQTVIHPDAAGIDLAAEVHDVAVPANRDPPPVRNFGTTNDQLIVLAEWLQKSTMLIVRIRDSFDQLIVLADWLQECGIRTVTMEATGASGIPLFELREARGREVGLVNAQHVRPVPGRKRDGQDCPWLQFLHSVGRLHASFRPALAICPVRTRWRHRDSLIQVAGALRLSLQKALDQINARRHRAVTAITGATGLAIRDAIVAGERDPQKLAAHRDHRCKQSVTESAAAPKGKAESAPSVTLNSHRPRLKNPSRAICAKTHRPKTFLQSKPNIQLRGFRR